MARQRTSSASGKKTQPPRSAATTQKPSGRKTIRATPGGKKPRTQPADLHIDTRTKFKLYNLLGDERAYYQVECFELEKPSAKPVRNKQVAHSILIIDRSGSMAPHVEDLKETLVKLLTLDEYSQYDLLVTLISYSSQGDCTVHFRRRPIHEIMKRDSKEIQEIQQIQVTGMTCISQALELAADLCRDQEITCVTLHSDGYANHPSASAEIEQLEKLCADMQKRPVFVNTIAYTDACDFRLLAKVANSVSGSCLKAGNIKEVYDSLYQTEKLLGSDLAAPVEVPLEEGYAYHLLLSHKGGKINGSAGPLKVIGLTEDDDALVYRYKKLSEAEYRKLKEVPQVQTGEAVLAFARAQLAEGFLNTAKYAVASSYDATLVERHAKALTNLQVAALVQDLDTVLFQPGLLQEHDVLDHVPVNNRISVLALAYFLGEHKGGFVVNLDHLKENYVRRGLRRVQGTRDDDGNLTEPALKAECLDKGDYAPVASFDINRNTANLNMLIARPVRLLPRAGGEPIREVAGIKLDRLTLFNNYTLIGDGALNLKSLQIKISDKKLFEFLKNEGVLEVDGQPATNYHTDTEYTLCLDELPLVPPFEGAVPLEGVFEDLAEVKVVSSIVDAHLKEDSDLYTPEQVAELKKHYLSKSLYLNFPTTTEYTDLQAALADGSVDVRVSYKIDLGSTQILNLGKLMPANKFLDRFYEVLDAEGHKISKPTFEEFTGGDVTVRHKQLSSRTKVTPVDDFMRRIFDDFFGLSTNAVLHSVLKRADATDLLKVLQEKHRGAKVSRAAYVAALTDAQRKLAAYTDSVYQEKVSPLVFYVGATGVLPDEMETKALTAEQLTRKYPALSLSKDEQEGLFFVFGDTILSVYARNEYFSR
jgi:Mg-chelatase subunit ChlD